MYISRIDLLNHEFSRVMRGYAPAEVETVIKDAATAIGGLSEEKNALEARITELEAQLAEHKGREITLRDTLMTTQRVTQDLKSAAQKEAQLIVEAAHAKAESLLNQCNQRLGRLQDEIATAHRVRAQVYMQVRASLEQHLALLNMTFTQNEESLPTAGESAEKAATGAQATRQAAVRVSAAPQPAKAADPAGRQNERDA